MSRWLTGGISIYVVFFLAVAAIACSKAPDPQRAAGIFAAILADSLAIFGVWLFVQSERDTPNAVPSSILFGIVIFLSGGLIAIVASAGDWFLGGLCAMASLLGGGIIGMLSAIPFVPDTATNVQNAPLVNVNTEAPADSSDPDPTPPLIIPNQPGAEAQPPAQEQQPSSIVLVNVEPQNGPAQASAAPPKPGSPAPKSATGSTQSNKPQSSATKLQEKRKQISTLGRAAERLNSVIGGAIAFNFHEVYGEWKHIANYIGSAVMHPSHQNLIERPGAYGAGIILYFALLGIVSGLLLTRIFLLRYLEEHD